MAENERIITSGSKRSGKSVPSGHDSFCMKQRESAREWSGAGGGGARKDKEERDKAQKKELRRGRKTVVNSVSHGAAHHTRCRLIDAPLLRSRPSVCFLSSHVHPPFLLFDGKLRRKKESANQSPI